MTWQSAGEFTCSNPLLNRIYHNIVWGVSGNYRSISTDCPQRDERQGWLGDRSAECKGETYLFDTAALYAKWLQDMADAQKANGSVPDVCPAYLADLLGQRHLAEQHRDYPRRACATSSPIRTIIARHYASAKKWMDYMGGFVTNGIIARDSYGDWCVPPEDPKLIHSNDPARKTDKALLATAYFYHDAHAHGPLRDACSARRRTRSISQRWRTSSRPPSTRSSSAPTPASTTTARRPRAYCRWRSAWCLTDERERVFDHLVEQDHRRKARTTSAPG